jgi:CSLREA domain-containing protein
MRTRAGIAFALGMLLLWTGASVAQAATITVTASQDEVTTNAKCSLREAVLNATANARTHPDCIEVGAYGADTILFTSGINPTLTVTGRRRGCCRHRRS